MKANQSLILVVDDNEMNRDLLSRRLKRQGHEVQTAENGRLALEQIKENDYDLILLDIMMPEMNGFEVLERLQADPQWRHIPVIVISAAENVENTVKAIQLGAEDYLPKPYNTSLLKARIGACLDKKRLRDKEQAYMTELAIMQQIDRELNASLDVQRAMNITLEWALRRTEDQVGLIGLMIDDEVHVIVSKGYTYELAQSNILKVTTLPTLVKALESHQVEVVSEITEGGLLVRAQSQVVVPIMRESAVTAVLILENKVPKVWSETMIGFLYRLSDHAALAIANAQMYAAVQSANLAKTEFVSFVSHELKIPMTSIKGYAELLIMGALGQLSEPQLDMLHTIRSNVDRMATLVSDLTDVSRIESGHLRLERTSLVLTEVIDEVIQSTRTQIQQKSQTLVLDLAEDLPLVWADRGRLLQVLINLVSNAYKYTPEEGHITIRTHITEYIKEETPHPMAQVSIIDTGLGIKEEDQATIFEKFVRVDDAEAIKSPGTGLGLSITKSLVEMHDGRIWFESQYRQGTTFHFVLPLAESFLEDKKEMA